MSHWSASYVGLPWREGGIASDGVACWGLALLAYAGELGILLPDYAAALASLEERAQIAAAFAGGTADDLWRPVSPGRERAFDIVVFRRAGLDAHVGIVTVPGRMLHITANQDSVITDYSSGRWAPRLSAIFRHRQMLGGADVA
ncbi:MAG: phage tail protein [Methylorubrum populi]|nr:MAG: phage tail protein [Methylorubrum populi]